MKVLNVVLAALGGAAVGAAVGLLLAPEKGVDTRKKISDYLKEKGIKLKKDKMDQLVEEIANEIENK